MTLSQSQVPRDAAPFLIGPLAHVRYELNGKTGYHIDWSKPGAIERFNAEQEIWWREHGEDWKTDP